MLLSIQETENTIVSWIKSCTNEDQLSLCNEAIDKFITDRFKHYASPAELALTCSRLETMVNNHKKKIVGIGLHQLN